MIGDIYYRFNDLAYSWVANESWTWRRNLPPLPGSDGGRWMLVCEGLQTIGTVSLGGEVLGRVDNQYRRWEFELPAGSGGRELRLSFESISGLVRLPAAPFSSLRRPPPPPVAPARPAV